MPQQQRASATKGFRSVIDGTSMLAVRVLNILASNIHLYDKVTNEKLTYTQKKQVDKEVEITEAVRTDDLRGIVEHINNCNRHSFRLKHNREPELDYIQLIVNDDYYQNRKVAVTECPKCQFRFKYEKMATKPTPVKCPSCGTEGIIR